MEGNNDIDLAVDVAQLCRKELYGLNPHLLDMWLNIIFRKMVNDATRLRASCEGYVSSNCNCI